MFKKFVVLLSATISVMVVGAVTSAAEATGPIQFRKIYYDSPGSDRGSNSSLNAEYFTVKNTGTATRDLSNWTVRDKTGYKYKFPSGSKLRAGYSVKIHTGSGSDTSANRYWDRSWYVWNNNGDAATLKNASGTKKDTCSWASTGSGYKNC